MYLDLKNFGCGTQAKRKRGSQGYDKFLRSKNEESGAPWGITFSVLPSLGPADISIFLYQRFLRLKKESPEKL